MNIEELRTALRDRVVVVVVAFRKVNGDTRIMDCTLNPDLIPTDHRPTGKVVLSEEAATRTLRVYDVNAEGWRSFIVENILEVK